MKKITFAVGCVLLLLCLILFSCTEDIPNPLTEENVRQMLKTSSGVTIENGDNGTSGNGSSTGNGTTSDPLPASGKIAFVLEDDNGSWVYLMNPDGTEQKQLSVGWLDMALYAPFWSPGEKVAYLLFLGSAIRVMNTDGTEHLQIAVDTGGQMVNTDSRFCWSYDGRIAFALMNEAFTSADIYTINADGTNLTQMTVSPEWGFSSYPSWSSDGTEIVFVFNDANGDSNIYVLDAWGLVTQLTFTGDEYQPVLSPDGTKIAFASDRDFDYEIYVMNTDGTNQVNLTNNPETDDITPTWSPDGNKIAFVSEDGNGNSDIYVMDSNGTNQVNITNTPLIDESMPSWSP